MERSREGWWPTPWWRTFHWRIIEKVLIQGWWTPQKSEKTVSSQTFCQQVPARSFGVLLINVFFRWKSSPILTEIAYIQRDPHILDNSGFRLFFDFFDFFRKNHENVQIRTKGFFAFFRFFRLLGDPPDGKKSWKNDQTTSSDRLNHRIQGYTPHLDGYIDQLSRKTTPRSTYFLRSFLVLSLLCLKARPDHLDLYGRVKLVSK